MIRKSQLLSALFIIIAAFPAVSSLRSFSTHIVNGEMMLQGPYFLTINIVGQGYVTPNATGPYNYNDVVQLLATLAPGWSFLRWSGDLNGSSNPGFILMNSNKTVTATFVQTNTLSLTVKTDKATYGTSDTVNINGTLSWVPNNIPISDGVVAVEVRDPAGNLFDLRTRPTGSAVGQNWLVNFTSFYPCDQYQVPKYTFAKGEDIWMFVQWENFDQINSHDVTEVSIFDNPNSAPIGFSFTGGTVAPSGISTAFFKAVSIVDSGIVGKFAVHASLLSAFPKDGGYPYCPEASAIITVSASPAVSPVQGTGSSLVLAADGTYSSNFTFPVGNTKHGYYNVSVSTYYYYSLATAKTTFFLPLIGDVNHDGVVDIYDAILLANAFNTKPNDARWNPNADINKDGSVDIYDAILLALHFNESG